MEDESDDRSSGIAKIGGLATFIPEARRGHYREYTVPTPGSRDRGARRIVTAGNPPSAYYYSDDHYRSFRRIQD